MSVETPPDVQAVLDAYLGALKSNLPGLVTGLYIHGSVALGAFDLHFSDVDFLALIRRRCTRTDLSNLVKIHQIVATECPRPALEGAYLQWEQLGQPEENIATYPYFIKIQSAVR